jgi:hypothetical protein
MRDSFSHIYNFGHVGNIAGFAVLYRDRLAKLALPENDNSGYGLLRIHDAGLYKNINLFLNSKAFKVHKPKCFAIYVFTG